MAQRHADAVVSRDSGAPDAALDGVLVIDKPAGMSSHDVVARVRRAIGDRARPRRRGKGGVKVGHAGTLDPDATGVLVVCVGRATRLVPFLQAGRKTYRARVRFGVETTTLDASGEVTATRDASAVDAAAVAAALPALTGTIEQVPPMVSAIKVGGERLYAKARRGEEVERTPRRVTVHALTLDGFFGEGSPHPEAELTVVCSAGTYVRSLAADLGARLGVGASLAALRRLASGRFTVDDAVDLDTVAAAGADGTLASLLIPPAAAVADYPAITVDAAAARALGHGQTLPATGRDGPVAAVTRDGTLVAMVADRDGRARPLVVLASGGGAPSGTGGGSG